MKTIAQADLVERPSRNSAMIALASLAFLLVGFGAFSVFYTHDQTQLLALGLVAVMATIGAFCIFAIFFGFLKWVGSENADSVFLEIINHSRDAFFITDASGNAVYSNQAYFNLNNATTLDEVQSPEGLFAEAPEAAQALYRLSQAALKGQSADEEIRIDRGLRGRGAAWYRIVTAPSKRAGGRAYQVWRVADVTQERDRQETVFHELQHAIDYLDHAPSGFFSVNRDGEIVYLNATLAERLGFDLAASGSGGLRLDQLVNQTEVPSLIKLSGPPGESQTEIIDTEIKNASGTYIPVRLYHQWTFDAKGTSQPSRTLVIERSVISTEKGDPLIDEQRFARLFNASPFGIVTIDSEGKIVRLNSAFGRIAPSKSSLIGEKLASMVAGSDQDLLRNLLESTTIQMAAASPLELKLAEEGRSARFYVTRLPLHGDGADEAAIIHVIDTTEQRALEAQFAQAQKMQAVGELAGGIAHDFNNVLQGILGYADLLLASHRPTDPAFQDIMEIKQNVNRAAGLVRHLLAFSRRQTLLPIVLQFTEVFSDLSRLLNRLLGLRIKLDIKHDRELWTVKADRTQFEQVIINLAMNSRDAMPDGGQLSIKTSNIAASSGQDFGDATIPKADYVMVEISDSGTGIAPELIDKIFEPFFTTKEVGKGTGLGLSMVYGFVKQSGGFILCDSKLGEGTRFRILLPRYSPDAAERAEEANARTAVIKASPDLSGQGTILLVEDEDAVRAFGARALSQRGYRVLEAATGLEALDVLANEAKPVDLIVSDVVMPEMDGPSLLREARARGIEARFIFVSGYAEDAFRKNLPEGESFGFLPKPFSLKQLIETVKAAVG